MTWMLFDTKLGPCGFAWNDAGLTWVQLPEHDREATRERLIAKVEDAGAMATPETAPAWVQKAMRLVCEHLAGEPQDLSSIRLDVSRVTPFIASVFRAAQSIPVGRTTTYGELAVRVGSAGASRAVGRAMATNRWPLIVPCHRVVAAGGGTGGFSAHGGLATKEKLLQLEGGTLGRQGLLFDDR